MGCGGDGGGGGGMLTIYTEASQLIIIVSLNVQELNVQ